MASAPPKRRRTSTSTSVIVDASNTELGVDTQHGNHRHTYRASYLSPTKASLARFYPHLLSNIGGPTAPRSKGKSLLEQRSSELKANKSSSVSQSSNRDSTISLPVAEAEGPAPRASPPEAVSVDDTGMDMQVPQVNSSIHGIGDSMTVHADKSTEFLGHKTSHFEKDEIINPSTPTKNGIHKAEATEPRLPSTPRQLGLEPPALKPIGALSISPSQKSKRRRPSSAKTSPLKPKEAVPQPRVIETHLESKLGPRRSFLDFSTESEAALAKDGPSWLGNSDEPLKGSPIIPMKAPIELAPLDHLFSIQASSSLVIFASQEIESAQSDTHGLRYRDVVLKSQDNILVVSLRLLLKEGSKKVASITILQHSSWNCSELEAWLKAPIADRTQGAIVKAVGRYWDMAETRAFCWYECKRDFGHLVERIESGDPADEEPTNAHGGWGTGVLQGNPVVDSALDFAFKVPDLGSGLGRALSETTFRFLCNKSLCFSDNVVSLHVRWVIRFKPSGEVISVVSARGDVPANWVDETDQNDISRVDEVFTKLIQSGKPVHESIRCVIKAMFPD